MTDIIDISLYGSFVKNFPGLVSVRDKDLKIVYANQVFRGMIAQYTDIDVIGLTNQELAELVGDGLSEVLLNCQELEVNYICNNNANNKVLKYETGTETRYIDILKFSCGEGNNQYTFTLGKDITHIYKQISYHKAQSHTDPLTKLGNRNLLNESFFDESDLFIYIDLDNFKMVNDIYGHIIGDEILVTFSQMLSRMFRQQDTIIRMGGDEFLVIIKADENETVIDTRTRITRIKNEFKKTFPEYPLLGVSIGASSFYRNIDQTLKTIDKLMYKDKKQKVTR